MSHFQLHLFVLLHRTAVQPRVLEHLLRVIEGPADFGPDDIFVYFDVEGAKGLLGRLSLEHMKHYFY